MRFATLVPVLWCALALAGGCSARAATPQPVAFGAYASGVPEWPSLIDGLAAQSGRRPAVALWYRDFAHDAFSSRELGNLAAAGELPMVTWEPWNVADKADTGTYSLRAIASGELDDYLRAEAQEASDWGRPILVRFAHEMNGGWYPWGLHGTGNSAAEYVGAWRHVVTLFRRQGARNVKWVWAPNVDIDGSLPFAAAYPGDSWVDYVGLDGYNWGTAKAPGWKSLTAIFGSSYDRLLTLSTRPVMITEVAANEDGVHDKPAWIASALTKELP